MTDAEKYERLITELFLEESDQNHPTTQLIFELPTALLDFLKTDPDLEEWQWKEVGLAFTNQIVNRKPKCPPAKTWR